MRSTPARIGLLVAVVAVAVVAFVLLKNNDSDSSGGTPVGTVQVLNVDANGDPVGGVKTLTYGKGDRVELRVNLAKPEEEIHVHGYEIEKPAERSPVTFSFPAKLDGEFEVEVHRLDGTEAPIAELHVNP